MQLAERPAVHLVVRQAADCVLRSLTGPMPLIMRVERGEKQVGGSYAFRISAGEIGIVPPLRPLDIRNRPERGRYEAQAIALPAVRLADLPQGADRFVLTRKSAAFPEVSDAFDRAVQALGDACLPETIRDVRLHELSLWLIEAGLSFPHAIAQPSSVRLRAMVAATPDADWSARRAASELACSEATLRRRLSIEGTSLSAIVTDARMTAALVLLQTTELPVGRIALEVGYASPSRFAVRFQKRFGISPSAIRTGQIDRFGMQVARIGTMPVRQIK